MDLGELIKAHRGDISYERLSKRAVESGHDISGTMLHAFATKPLPNIPRVETIHAIAAALRVSAKEVLDASAESVGLLAASESELQNVTNRTQVNALLAVIRHRPPDEVEHLSRVVRTVADVLDARDSSSTTTE
jgi:hypothetical protein